MDEIPEPWNAEALAPVHCSCGQQRSAEHDPQIDITGAATFFCKDPPHGLHEQIAYVRACRWCGAFYAFAKRKRAGT